MSKALAGNPPGGSTTTMRSARMAAAMKKAPAMSWSDALDGAGRRYNRSEPSQLKMQVRPDDPVGLRSARATLRKQLGVWGLEPIGDTAALLASELLTNALTHSHGCALFTASPMVNAVRLEVYDSGGAVPCVREAAEEDVSGRGMMLVEALARSWGVERCHRGKRVWCEIPVEPC